MQLDDTLLGHQNKSAVEGGLSPESIERQLTTSLKRLGLRSLDLFHLHSPDLAIPIRNSLQAVDKLKLTDAITK